MPGITCILNVGIQTLRHIIQRQGNLPVITIILMKVVTKLLQTNYHRLTLFLLGFFHTSFIEGYEITPLFIFAKNDPIS